MQVAFGNVLKAQETLNVVLFRCITAWSSWLRQNFVGPCSGQGSWSALHQFGCGGTHRQVVRWIAEALSCSILSSFQNPALHYLHWWNWLVKWFLLSMKCIFQCLTSFDVLSVCIFMNARSKQLSVKSSFRLFSSKDYFSILLFSPHPLVSDISVITKGTLIQPQNSNPTDSFLRVRATGDHEATAMMKAQFLQQWDGLATDNSRFVVVMGATNRPQDVDRAILRRMPAAFHIPLPVSSINYYYFFLMKLWTYLAIDFVYFTIHLTWSY